MAVIKLLILGCLIFGFGAFEIFAQVSINGSLSGRVADSSGASVGGANVVLTNVDTRQIQTAETNADGVYNFARLAPGVYRLRVERTGFSAAQTANIRVSVNESAVADLTLQIGAISETVNVTANREITQTQTTNVSQIIETREIADLPLNSKDFQKLTLLAPGVGGQISANTSSTNFSVSGARETDNNYVLDGVTANDERGIAGLAPGNFGQVVPNVISTEAIQEFRLITSNADATFGRGSGGQINVITKRGGNDFRGSLYEYLRNDALDARNFFNRGPIFNADGKAKNPPFKQHLYGGTIGGRLFLPGFGEGSPAIFDRRDKDFFFFSFEGFRQKRRESGSVELPNADFINLFRGDLGRLAREFYFGSGIVPTAGNRAGQFFPLAQANRTAAITAGFNPILFDGNPANGEAGTILVSDASRRDFDQNAFLIRTDHNFTEKFTGAFRYAFADNNFDTDTLRIPTTERASRTRFHSFVAQFIYAFSPAQILEVRGGFLRTSFTNNAPANNLDSRFTNLGISSADGLTLQATGTTFLLPGFVAASGFTDNQRVPQIAVLHTFNRGKFTVRAGLDVRYVDTDFANNNFRNPTFQFNGIVGRNGLIGANPAQTDAIAATVRQTIFGRDPLNPNNIIGPTTPLRRYQFTQQEYFVQIDWRVFSRLTLNLGVRYSFFGVPKEANNVFSNLYARNPNTGEIVPNVSPFAFGRIANVVAPVADGRPLYKSDKNDFQPRIGAAFDIFGNGKSVVRAAYGLYVDRLVPVRYSIVGNNPPFVFSGALTASAPEPSRIFRLGQTATVNPLANPIISSIDPGIENPQAHRFSVAFEQAIDRSTSVNVAYVNLRGRKLIHTTGPNFAGAFPQTSRPDTRFADQRIYGNFSSSDYDSLQIYARRRFENFGSFTVSYTLGRLIDESDGITIATIPSIINLGANPNQTGIQTGAIGTRPMAVDRGFSDLDVRHNFVISHVFELPFGRGKRFFSNANGFLNAVIGNFEIAGIGVFRSGQRFNVTTGTDYNEDGAFNDRPALLSGNLNDLYNQGGNPTQILLPGNEARLRLGQPTDVTNPFLQIPRNAFRAPNVRFYDISIARRFRFTETINLKLEANIFNLTNTPNFAAPITFSATPNVGALFADLSSPLFGQTTRTDPTTNPRQIQLGVKLNF